jgi:hypothetical protein
MGTEIIVITIANLWVFGYSVLIRFGRFILVKAGAIDSGLGILYKRHAAFVGVLALIPSLYFLWEISADYGFAIMYILIIQTPIILLTLWVLMGFSAWMNNGNE